MSLNGLSHAFVTRSAGKAEPITTAKATHKSEGNTVNIERAGAVALILGTLATFAVMGLHPAGHISGHAAEVARVLRLGIVVHALAIGTAPLLTFGVFALTRNIGLDRPLASLALAFYTFGAVAVMCAAIMSGLVAPRLMEAGLAPGADSAILHGLSQLEWYLNQSFATVHVALFSIAIVLLSLCWPEKNALGATIQISGFTVGIGIFAWLVSGALTLDVHGMGAVVLLQGIWILLVAFGLLARARP